LQIAGLKPCPTKINPPFQKGEIKRGIFKENIKILPYKNRRFYGKNT
jgi:hypothetical protein